MNSFIRLERVKYKNCKYAHKVFVYKCLNKKCSKEIRVRSGADFSGKCKTCTNRKTPFGSQYQRLKSRAKISNIILEITYKQYLEYTKINKCYYCGVPIEWCAFRSDRTENSSPYAYYLDRKNCSSGYTRNNVVVCCSLCNYTKLENFNFEEFKLLGKTIKKIRKMRSLQTSPLAKIK